MQWFKWILGATLVFSSISQADEILDQVKTFAQSKDGVCALLDELAASSCVTRDGKDADQRPIFVGAQADFERLFAQLLNKKEIISLFCIIHTPAPATPLCTKGEISEGLVDPSLLNDPERLLTVKKRPDILRDYLRSGGTLYTVYPKGGRNIRSLEQLQILDSLLEEYPEHLFAQELDCAEIPRHLIGATYLITFADFQQVALSLRSYQANRPADDEWGIWFGPLSNPAVAERLDEVFSFLDENGFAPVLKLTSVD